VSCPRLQRNVSEVGAADIEVLNRELNAWHTRRNHMQKGVDWQFTTADARIKLKRLYPIDL
jgi:hypothetical protein